LFLCAVFVVSCLGQTNKGLLFFEGFAIGVEAEIGDPKQCAADAKLTLNDFELGYATIKQGIWDFSISEVQQGLLDWSKGLDEMVQALHDCGAYQLAADIAKLQADIATGEGILKLIAEEILNIIENDIAGLFRGAINAFRRGDYYNAGVYTGQITGLLLNVNVTAQQDPHEAKAAGKNAEIRHKFIHDMMRRHGHRARNHRHQHVQHHEKENAEHMAEHHKKMQELDEHHHHEERLSRTHPHQDRHADKEKKHAEKLEKLAKKLKAMKEDREKEEHHSH